LRCFDGDLFPTPVDENRKVVADFDAVILLHAGHFPMLERPEEFNRRLEERVLRLAK
jgi:pimeloyl-ACP methyl ester carboxylesterase